MPTRLTGLPALASLGVEAPQPPNLVSLNRAPTVNDFANFNTGDLWLNTASLLGANPTAPTAEDVWMLVSKNKRIANATWINFSGGNALLTLTGNIGGAVPGDPNQNINTIGDNIGITVTGNPATNTLTWSLVGGGVATQSYLTDDAQVEVPNAAGQLTVTGTGVVTVGNVYSNTNTLRGANVNTVGAALNNSIGQPNTNITATTGMYALGTNNNFVTDRFMYNYGTNNTFLGNSSGNLTLTVANASYNTCIGFASGNALVGTAATNAALNTFVGSLSGAVATDAGGCVFLGNRSGFTVTTGNSNTAIGTGSLNGLVTGSNCISIGMNSSTAFTGAESNNITIGTSVTGVAADTNTLRIGNIAGSGTGSLTRAFCQGIYGVNPGGTQASVIINSVGQLGTGATPVNPFATTAFYATNSTSPANYFTLGTAVIIGLDTIVFDLGGNFNTGTSLYTAPNTGYYWFNAMITLGVIPNTITECTMEFVPSVGAGVFGPVAMNPFTYQATTVTTGLAFGGSWMTHLAAGTTMSFQVLLGGSGGNTGYDGGSGRTFFQGYQIF